MLDPKYFPVDRVNQDKGNQLKFLELEDFTEMDIDVNAVFDGETGTLKITFFKHIEKDDLK